jgi:tetratricopeptide (TPR) repeat protein
MLTTIKRSLYALSNRLRRQPGRMKEKWTADFSHPEKSCFNIKPEISFNAYLEKGSLFLGLKKKNCMAWLETSGRVYVDQVINARFRIDSFENYCSSGIMFRVMERGTYYLALVSSKGYFRLDSVKNGVPSPLIGWTETPGFNEHGVIFLTVITKGDHLIFILNGRWVAEAHDNSLPGGHLGFPLVSYGPDGAENGAPQAGRYSCQAWLDFLSVDSRAGAVEAEYKKWKDSPEITAESRLRLAESLVALNRPGAAYDQILSAWKQREEAAFSVSATYTEMRSRGELFLAARLTRQLGRFAAAEDYINICLAMGTDVVAKGGGTKGSFDMTEAFAEKVKILSAQNKFAELAAFLPEYIKRVIENSPPDVPSSDVPSAGLPALYALLGHACRNIKDHKAAAEAWDTAFSLNRHNGLYAANAAGAYELAGRDDAALQRRLSAGKIFLQQEDFTELGALLPKLSAAGKKNPEARLLAAQYLFATGDFDRAEAELALYEELRLAGRPVHQADPAAQHILGEIRKKKPAAVPAAALSATLSAETPARTAVPVMPPPHTVVTEGNLGSVEPRCRVPAKPAEKAAPTKKKTPPVKKPAKAKPAAKAVPAKGSPAKGGAVKKKTRTAAKAPAKAAVKKPAPAKAGKAGAKAGPAAKKPATTAKKTPPVKPAKAKAKPATKEKKPAVKTKAKPAAKTGPAKGGAVKKKGGTAAKTPAKAAGKKAAPAKAGAKPKPAAKKPAKAYVKSVKPVDK